MQSCSRRTQREKVFGDMQNNAVGREERQSHTFSLHISAVPRMRLLIPSRLTKTLSRSSLPVKSSAITYRLGLTALAASNMAWTTNSNITDKERESCCQQGHAHTGQHGCSDAASSLFTACLNSIIFVTIVRTVTVQYRRPVILSLTLNLTDNTYRSRRVRDGNICTCKPSPYIARTWTRLTEAHIKVLLQHLQMEQAGSRTILPTSSAKHNKDSQDIQ